MKPYLLVVCSLLCSTATFSQFNLRVGSTLYHTELSELKTHHTFGLGYQHTLSKAFNLDVAMFKTGYHYYDVNNDNQVSGIRQYNVSIGVRWQTNGISLGAGVILTRNFVMPNSNLPAQRSWQSIYVDLQYDISKRFSLSARYVPKYQHSNLQLNLIYKTKWFIKKE